MLGKAPNTQHPKSPGCAAYKRTRIPAKQRSDKKFGARLRPCTMLCYVNNTTKVYRPWSFDQRQAIECSNVRWYKGLNAFEPGPTTGTQAGKQLEKSMEPELVDRISSC